MHCCRSWMHAHCNRGGFDVFEVFLPYTCFGWWFGTNDWLVVFLIPSQSNWHKNQLSSNWQSIVRHFHWILIIWNSIFSARILCIPQHCHRMINHLTANILRILVNIVWMWFFFSSLLLRLAHLNKIDAVGRKFHNQIRFEWISNWLNARGNLTMKVLSLEAQKAYAFPVIVFVAFRISLVGRLPPSDQSNRHKTHQCSSIILPICLS